MKAAGFVLAGGLSSRMGSDKALVRFAGAPLILNAIRLLAGAGISARIAGARAGLAESEFGREMGIIPDTYAESGPLGGVHAALSVSDAEWNVFLPVDMPLMPSALLAWLVERAELTGCPVVALKRNGRLEPYPVLLHRDVLAGVSQRLREGQTAGHLAWRTIPKEMGSALDAPAVEDLVQCGQVGHPLGLPSVYWFQSANTPEELGFLERLYISRQRPSASVSLDA